MMSALQLRQSKPVRSQPNVNVSGAPGSLQPLNCGLNNGNQTLNLPSQNTILSLRAASNAWDKDPFGIAHNYENALWFGHREVSGGKNACGWVNIFLFIFFIFFLVAIITQTYTNTNTNTNKNNITHSVTRLCIKELYE